MRERADGLRRAELMVWLTERVARGEVAVPQRVRTMAAEALSSFPEARVDTERVLAAASALRAAEERWAALSPGEELVEQWPARRAARSPVPGAARARRDGRPRHRRHRSS
jgi:hypothetical protein